MKWKALIFPATALVIAGVTSMFIVLLAGESPMVLLEAFQNTLFTSFGLGYTLFYTTPLIFTGLSVAVAFHCGLFNIGAEGQLY
ncbi:MAG: ABC transporter permease, partial [Verrucomicrobiales bacterium]